MGKWVVDKTTKGFKAVAAVPASEMRDLDSTKISPALKHLIEAFGEAEDNEGVPIEIGVRITGREDRFYTVVLSEVEEIQEVLQWGIVPEEKC